MVFWGRKKKEFGSSSTAEEVTEGVDATGLTALVTGGTSGIGKETVRVLAKRGAHVYLGARNLQKAAEVKDEFLRDNPSSKVDLIKVDTSSLESVRSAAKEFLAKDEPLNILVNNAGIMFFPFQKSADGVELQFATNYLGHFLLTNLLVDKMKSTAKASGVEGRIINVSSMGHSLVGYKEGIRFEKLNDKEGYSQFSAYGQSKLAQVLTTKELSRRLQAEGANVTVNTLHPGNVRTSLTDHNRIMSSLTAISKILPILKTPEQGAATQCYLALNPAAKGVTGKYYFDDIKERESPNKFVKDEALWTKLWDFSVQLTTPQSSS